MVRTHVYKLKPTAKQVSGLENYLRITRLVYNSALEQRIEAWKRGKSVSWIDQAAEIKDVRSEGFLDDIFVNVTKQTLKRLDLAYAAFFRRCKEGAKQKGFPRFKGARYWRSFAFPEYGNGCDIRDGRLRVSKIGSIRIRQHRPLEGTPKTCMIVRKSDGWYVHIGCDLGDAPALRGGDRKKGLDLGLESFATLADGERIENPRLLRHAERKLKHEQKSLSRKKRGSNRRNKQRERLALAHLKLARTRLDFHQKLALNLVQRFDGIAVEELTGIRARIRARRPQRSRQSGWAFAQLRAFIEYKALLAGVPVIVVDPRNTSRTCPECGHCEKANRHTQAEFVCRSCGHAAPADINAARNIASRAPVMEPMVRGGLSCAAA